MARTCTLAQDGLLLNATWALDDDSLTLTPAGAPPRSILLREIEGIGGTDTEIELSLGSAKATLARLGADSVGLRRELLAAWLPARIETLRLAGEGERFRFSGAVALPGRAAVPMVGVLTRHAILVAPTGEDVVPLFLAEIERFEFDADRWALSALLWGGERCTFSRLAAATDAVRAALEAARSTLADSAAAVLARHLPALSPTARTALATRWLPGRFLPLVELDAFAGGAADALFASWVASQPRATQGAALRQWAADGTLFAGYATDGDEASLWLLARRGDRLLLESISQEDWATYRFAGGDEMPSLAGRLLCAPQFSREALYLRVEELSGERADYAIAARSLPFLRHLRDRLRGRIIHTEPAAWREALDED